MKRLIAAVLAVAVFASYLAVTQSTTPIQAGNDKVMICHRTDSATNPYTMPSVDADSVDGNTGNDNGQGDHTTHTGPVATSQAVAQALKDAGQKWGDIIPPHHNFAGYNWTAQGQAIYNNGCNYVTPPTNTSTPVPTSTSTPVPTSTSTPVPTSTSTPVPTSTSTPEPTATSTSEPTSTSTPSPTATGTPQATPTQVVTTTTSTTTGTTTSTTTTVTTSTSTTATVSVPTTNVFTPPNTGDGGLKHAIDRAFNGHGDSVWMWPVLTLFLGLALGRFVLKAR